MFIVHADVVELVKNVNTIGSVKITLEDGSLGFRQVFSVKDQDDNIGFWRNWLCTDPNIESFSINIVEIKTT